jgi:transcriptional regulator with XRE-family HTH domain
MENHQPGISSRVKQLRTERAWSQEQLANICEVSVRTIQRLENGEKVSFETLKAIATAFDLDVRDLTEGQTSIPEGKEAQKANVIFMRRLTSGNELSAMIGGTHFYRLQNDELDTAKEVELVGSFFQDIRDIGDIWDDIEPMQKVEQGHRFTQMMGELEEYGLWVFAARTKARYRPTLAQIEEFPMNIVSVLVLRDTNPTIIKGPPSKEAVAAIFNA